jgi:hypothetical protein
LKFLFPLALLLLASAENAFSSSHIWTKTQKILYHERKFIELEQDLFSRGEVKMADEIQKQNEDLPGCRSIHEGKGSMKQLTECMSFLNREAGLGLQSKSAGTVVLDINILCEKLSNDSDAIKNIIVSRVLLNRQKTWASCLSSVWKQVFLTSYANFEASPVSTLAFVRQAQRLLPFDKYWTLKAIRLAGGH